MKKIIKPLIFIAIILGFILIINKLSETKFSSAGTLGNTAANIYNGGLFCENDGYIYFSNFNDSGSLYRMTENCDGFEKLYSDKAAYINADEHYVYYVRQNYKRKTSNTAFNAFNFGICRLNKSNGKGFKSVSSDYAEMMILYDNNLYFQKYDVSSAPRLFRIEINGSYEYFMSEDAIKPAGFYNGSLLYSGISEDHDIRLLAFTGYEGSTLYEESSYMPVFYSHSDTDKYIYYISVENNYALCRIRPDGTDRKVLVDNFCSTFNISNDGKYLFFQLDNTAKHSLSKLDLTTMEQSIVLEGDYKDLHITSKYLFFTDFADTAAYAYSLDGTNTLNVFNPPVID